MATKKSSTKKSSTKKIDPIKVDSFAVTRVKPYDEMYFFDLTLNGVRIYGCKLIEGENGWFIGFPSKKPTKKKNGKWYNHVWVPLSEDDTVEIIAAVMEQADDDDDDDDDDDLPF